MSLLMGFSALWFRVKAYDVFLLIHLAGALVTLVTLFYHTEIWNHGSFSPLLLRLCLLCMMLTCV